MRIKYNSTNQNTFYQTHIDIGENEIIISAYNLMGQKTQIKPELSTEYKFALPESFEFGCFWQKKEWQYFYKVNSQAPIVYLKEKEFKEIMNCFSEFKNYVESL